MTDSICYPPGTEWSCAYSEADLTTMWADPHTAATMRRAEALAWSTLAALTAYQLGTCPIVVRPCAARCKSAGSYRNGAGGYPGLPTPYMIGSFNPHLEAGVWVNSCGCQSAYDCSCTVLCEAILPGPVGRILEVKLDGAVLTPGSYRVDNQHRLVRTDGGCWPVCQDLGHDDEDVGLWVTYYRGAAPNPLTLYAAGVLAAEYYLACTGNDCRLPAGVTSVSRQGVSFQVATGLFQNGFTGIREVDAIIGLYNPNGLTAPPSVSSPDMRGARITTAR